MSNEKLKPTDRIKAMQSHKKGMALNAGGQEVPDPRPMEPPVGYVAQPTLMELMASMLQQHQRAQELLEEDFDTEEDADDFDVGEDYEPESPHEHDVLDEAYERSAGAREEAARRAAAAATKAQDDEAQREILTQDPAAGGAPPAASPVGASGGPPAASPAPSAVPPKTGKK